MMATRGISVVDWEHPSGKMSAVVAEYERAVGEKDALEAEIAGIVEELTAGAKAPGISGALVDADGFPRSDIDVYRVRHQRHTLAVKQNDHRAVMKRIETLLPQVFEARMGKSQSAKAEQKSEPSGSPTNQAPESAALSPAPIQDAERALAPFARVESVQRDSPAAWAGLQAGDQVLRFGSADASNHRHLAAVKEIVQRNVGSAVSVLVRRRAEDATAGEWQVERLALTPQRWSGAGVLGCLLQPL